MNKLFFGGFLCLVLSGCSSTPSTTSTNATTTRQTTVVATTTPVAAASPAAASATPMAAASGTPVAMAWQPFTSDDKSMTVEFPAEFKSEPGTGRDLSAYSAVGENYVYMVNRTAKAANAPQDDKKDAERLEKAGEKVLSHSMSEVLGHPASSVVSVDPVKKMTSHSVSFSTNEFLYQMLIIQADGSPPPTDADKEHFVKSLKLSAAVSTPSATPTGAAKTE